MTCRKNMIYLDNAASSFPKPRSVYEKMNSVMRNNTANPGRSGHRLSLEASQIIFDARSVVADFFGISGHEENIVFTFNATLAINTVLRGLLRTGDHIIISDVEHNSVLRPLVAMKKDGISFSVAETFDDDELTVSSFRKLIRPETKMIFVCHASNVSGAVLPVDKLGSLCKEHNILFGIDASQTAGHIPIDLLKMNISVLCAPGHKGLYGPQGTGVIVISPELKQNIEPFVFGGTGTDSLLDIQPKILPEYLECGTLNTVGIAGLAEGVRFCKNKAISINTRIGSLFDLTYSELEKIPFISILSPKNNNAGIVSFSVEGVDSETVTRYLDSFGICVRGGFHCSSLFHNKAGTVSFGAVRISPGFFNTEKDIILCINSIKRLKN
ncbi:MAG: aminotransferase class V-fold PLP-dependent enzyme [Ruminococcaceae bacterium]|nr:aminotransferase class V-fold PLP-dependent enzyme [Oscillospiraceae bacterium]